MTTQHLLVTGATGYVGGRLIPLLLAAGHRVRVLARDPARLQGRPWLAQVEVVQGDVLQAQTLPAAMTGITAAYYLVHSMSDSPDFHERDMTAAANFGRWLLPVPVLTPRLSSYWVHWVTPVPAAIAQPLIQGLRNEVIVRDDSARRLFPSIRPLDYATALRFTLAKLDAGEVQTTWKDALVSSQGDVPPVTFTVQEGILIEQRQQVVAAAPETAFRIFAGIGGRRGWFYANWAWELRGLADRLIGGVGLRRGRRHPDDLRVGDALDFWRVEAVEAPRLLRLRAEMKVPGLAWLQFETQPQPDGRTRLVQTAFFASKGLFGLLYWYALYPLHGVIFSGMIREIARRAEQTAPTP